MSWVFLILKMWRKKYWNTSELGRHFHKNNFQVNAAWQFLNGGNLPHLCLCPLEHLTTSRENSEKAMAPHSSTLAWKIPWTEEPGRLQSMRLRESDTTECLHFHFSLSCTGEGNGSPLQCSCLENPRDGGAWWAAVSGVAQSRTRLKWLSSSKGFN